jgi:hypothetical protein
MKRMTICAIAAVLSVSVSSLALASSITDIGYTTLQGELGAATPTGAGVKVTQVEAPTNDTSGGAAPIFMPDPSDGQFIGKTITAINGNPSGSFSGHATGVGQLFYGNGSSIASGVTQVDSYEATAWLNSLSVSSGPALGAATTSTSRIANSSWVGTGATAAQTGTILRIVDRQVQLNEYINVVGLANGNSNQPLLGSAYNVIAVGRTDGIHQQNTVAVAGDSLYGTVRSAPLLVAPESTTSTAAPVVSAAAAVLVQTGHDGGLTLSKGSTVIAGIGTVYNAERSETVKAALMAGADRETANTSTSANITDYRSVGHQTNNGLDDRYGAGQVSILNSYHIVAGGEQKSLQQGGGDIGRFGFDYVGAFGGLNGSPRTTSYFFNAATDATLFSSLVWNVGLSNNSALTTTLHDLNLSLYDVTLNALMAQSASTVDNTENLWVTLLGGNRYELRVTAGDPANFSWDYALAWRLEGSPAPVPLPAAVWLFGSGLAGLVAMARRSADSSHCAYRNKLESRFGNRYLNPTFCKEQPAMNKITTTFALAGLLISGAFIVPAQANTLQVSGTLNQLTTGPLIGTTFDIWKINMPTAGNFTVDVLAYEASQSNVTTVGYSTSDLNGDGELAWLDPDTYFYKDDGILHAADALVRCDDIANNCGVYQNGLTAATSPVTVTTLTQAEGATDGSIHFRRDPAYNVTAAPGNYLLLIADFRLDPAEAEGGINTNDSFGPPTGFVGGITDHADYRFTLSSSTLNFSIDGNTINASPIPLPAAVWLFGSGLAGIVGYVRRRAAA